MRNLIKMTFIATSLISTFSYADSLSKETNKLDEINVVSEAIKKKDEVFIKTAATSTRDKILDSTQQIDTIVRSVPGAFTQMDKSQGTISVNVRGMTGFGRVNTMIDGVTQTFYSSSADGNGRGGGTTQFGTIVDPSFLTSVDIERGAFSSASGGNSLMGSANFKTIGVNDLIEEGKNIGFLAKSLWGTNALGPNYMGAVAAKYNFDDSHWIGAVYGYSWRKISQDYKIGGGRKVTDSSIDLTNSDYIKDEYDIANTNTSPFDSAHLIQRPTSHLAKIEYGDNYNNIVLAFRNYHTNLAKRDAKNNSYQVNYNFHIPDSSWVDFGVLYSENIGKQKYLPGVRITGKELKAPVVLKNNAKTIDLHNTFRANVWNTDITTTMGYNVLKNKYYKSRHPSELNYNLDEEDESTEEADCFGFNCFKKAFYTSTFQPDGAQKTETFYVNNTLTYKMFTLDLNANVAFNKFKGNRFKYLPMWIEDLQNEASYLSRNKKYQEANNINDRVDNLRSSFCTKSLNDFYDPQYDAPEDQYEYDCPDRNIAVKESGKHRNVNYSATLSAAVHELFTPFISYSKTNRVPNINEIFFSNVGDYGVNTRLKPESAKTYQVGINGFTENLFTDNDKFGFKIVGYKTKIDDYIFNVSKPKTFGGVIYHKNRVDPVKISGVELELSYDIGRFYANLSYAHQDTNQPISFTDASSRTDVDPSESEKDQQGYGQSKVAILPKDYGALEIGSRWLDNKLVIGSIAKYYGKSKRASTHKTTNIFVPGSKTKVQEVLRNQEEIPKQPIIFDFYMSYEPIKNLVIKGEIQNVFDKKYIDPLDSNNDSASQTYYNLDIDDQYHTVLNNFARGRTYVMSLSYKF